MACRILAALALGALLGPFPAAAQIINNWGGGSIRAGVTTGTSVTTSRENSTTTSQTYAGEVLAVTGSNVTASGPLGPDTTYALTEQGAPFQFSISRQDAGLVQLSTTTRSIDTTTTTSSMSVFSEVGN